MSPLCHPHHRRRRRPRCCQAIRDRLASRSSMVYLMGAADAPKLLSSAAFFAGAANALSRDLASSSPESVSEGGVDGGRAALTVAELQELEAACREVVVVGEEEKRKRLKQGRKWP